MFANRALIFLIAKASDEISAVQEAKAYYSDADGCATCCPKAHKG